MVNLKNILTNAKRAELLVALDGFYAREYDGSEEETTIPSNGIISIAYTETEDGTPVQVSYDLCQEMYLYEIDGVTFGSLATIDELIDALNFGDFSSFIDDALNYGREIVDKNSTDTTNADTDCCPACGSERMSWDAVQVREGEAAFGFKCNACGAEGSKLYSLVFSEWKF